MQLYIAFITLAVVASAKQNSYEGYKVYRVQPSGKRQVDAIAVFSENEQFDFWSPLRHDGSPIDIMTSPHMQEAFESFLKINRVKYSVLVENVERLIQEERSSQLKSAKLNETRISFTKYHRHEEINSYLDQLSRDHSDLVALETIGKSFEGRDLKLIKISTNFTASKPVIFIDAGIHAREWAAPPVALYTINQLVENAENANLLEKVDYHILPVVNPDGYEYTHETVRSNCCPVGNEFPRSARGAVADSPGARNLLASHSAGGRDLLCATFTGRHMFVLPATGPLLVADVALWTGCLKNPSPSPSPEACFNLARI